MLTLTVLSGQSKCELAIFLQTCQYWFVGVALEVLEDLTKRDCLQQLSQNINCLISQEDIDLVSLESVFYDPYDEPGPVSSSRTS